MLPAQTSVAIFNGIVSKVQSREKEMLFYPTTTVAVAIVSSPQAHAFGTSQRPQTIETTFDVFHDCHG